MSVAFHVQILLVSINGATLSGCCLAKKRFHPLRTDTVNINIVSPNAASEMCNAFTQTNTAHILHSPTVQTMWWMRHSLLNVWFLHVRHLVVRINWNSHPILNSGSFLHCTAWLVYSFRQQWTIRKRRRRAAGIIYIILRCQDAPLPWHPTPKLPKFLSVYANTERRMVFLVMWSFPTLFIL